MQSTTSSMPQSAATTDRPPSVTTSSTGASLPVVRISRHRSRAWASFLAAVDEDDVDLGRLEQRAALGGQDAHLVGEQGECGQHLGGGLRGAGQQQQGAHGVSRAGGAERDVSDSPLSR